MSDRDEYIQGPWAVHQTRRAYRITPFDYPDFTVAKAADNADAALIAAAPDLLEALLRLTGPDEPGADDYAAALRAIRKARGEL